MCECEKENSKERDRMSQQYESPYNRMWHFGIKGYRVRNEMKGEIEL